MQMIRIRSLMTAAAFLASTITLANSVTVDPVTGETTYVFDTEGAFSWTANASQTVQLLVVGGGGGGGCGNEGGGGGGGQVYHNETFAVTKGTTYSGTVGAGGAGGTNRGAATGRWQGDNGGDSVFGDIICPGGGGGGGNGGSATKTGVAGGNSGGASCPNGSFTSPAATGTDDAANGWYGGHAGGNSQRSTEGRFSGGGGGAIGVGGFGYKDAGGLNYAGNGGDGYSCAITGETVYYGCGGGAGCNGEIASPYTLTTVGGDAGSGNASGGAGAKAHTLPGSAATDGTGSGGGGGGWNGASSTVGGKGGRGVVVIRYILAAPVVEVTGVDRFQDGEEAVVDVKVTYPLTGYTVAYGASAAGPWSEAPITRTEAGTTPVWVKVSAPGLEDSVVSTTIVLRDPSAENDGTFYFVVPEGTAGNTPTAPYQTWATAANDLQTVVNATAGNMAGFAILVQNGTYPVVESLAISNTVSTVRSWTPVTGKIVSGGAVFNAGRKHRVGVSKAKELRGLAFVNGYVENGYGGGLRVEGPSIHGVVADCVFSNNWVSALSGNKSTPSLGGGVHVSVPTTFRNCLFVDNVATAATDTVVARGGAVHADSTTTYYRGCTFLRNVASSNKSGNGPNGAALAAAKTIEVEDCAFLTNRTPHVSGSSAFGGTVIVYVNQGTNSRIANSRFIGNSCPEFGIAKLPYSGSVITNCLFKDNAYGNGADSSAPLVVGCDFVGNSGNISYCESTIYRNCRFYKNYAFLWQHGSGNTKVSCENCTFVQNESVVYCQNAQGTRSAHFTNCAFADNTRDFGCNAAAQADMTLVASNCSFTVAASTNLLKLAGDLLVTANPRFVDKTAGDLHIKASSPLRERGKFLSWMIGSGDLDGNPRVVDPQGKASATALPDIGCYECQELKPGLVAVVR